MPLRVELVTGLPDDVAGIAARLCGAAVLSAQSCLGGANNRVYRIVTADGMFALKCYGSNEFDGRDRLGHEFGGLQFLQSAGIGTVLPAALGIDRTARCALYTWIEGKPVIDHGVADVNAVLELFAALHDARSAGGASALPLATEAVLQRSEVMRQLTRRFDRLRTVAPDEPELAAFLTGELEPELARRSAARAHEPDTEIPAEARTLSPSDFGFHNALRRPDGSLAFLDFEYFGWDDPVKLTADFLWHPGMRLDTEERQTFLAGARRLYRDDGDFGQRLCRLYPLYGIRWALIVLNEFLPKMWDRRSFAGKETDRTSAKANQLLKARSILATVRAFAEGNMPQ